MDEQARAFEDAEHRRGRGEGDAMEAPPTLGEWLVAAFGLLLVVGSIAFLLHDASRGDGPPPQPAIHVLGIEPQPVDGRFLVRLRVDNRSRSTAASLRVEGTLKQGEEVVERSETEFPFLPGGSSREAGLFFGRDPRSLTLELSARSFQQP